MNRFMSPVEQKGWDMIFSNAFLITYCTVCLQTIKAFSSIFKINFVKNVRYVKNYLENPPQFEHGEFSRIFYFHKKQHLYFQTGASTYLINNSCCISLTKITNRHKNPPRSHSIWFQFEILDWTDSMSTITTILVSRILSVWFFDSHMLQFSNQSSTIY